VAAGGRAVSDDAIRTTINLVSGSIALAPLIATVIALTTPTVRQNLSSAASERRLTLLGMWGQFDGLESATGVVPLVVVLVVALLAQVVAAVAVLATTRPESSALPRWPPVALMVTGSVTVVIGLLLVPVLGNADDVGNPQPAVDAPYGLTGTGWVHLTLAGVVAIVGAALIRSTREWIE
jgi:hypothetical protein